MTAFGYLGATQGGESCGGRGDDTLTGGAGADTFHGAVGVGLDWIADFNPADGDRIQLDSGTPFSLAQLGADTVVSIGSAGDQMVLRGVQLTSLTGAWLFQA